MGFQKHVRVESSCLLCFLPSSLHHFHQSCSFFGFMLCSTLNLRDLHPNTINSHESITLTCSSKKIRERHFQLISFICKIVITSGDDATLHKAKGCSVKCSQVGAESESKPRRVHLNAECVLMEIYRLRYDH